MSMRAFHVTCTGGSYSFYLKFSFRSVGGRLFDAKIFAEFLANIELDNVCQIVYSIIFILKGFEMSMH